MRQASLLELNGGGVGCGFPEYLILHDELLGILLEDSGDDVGAHVGVLLKHGANSCRSASLISAGHRVEEVEHSIAAYQGHGVFVVLGVESR
jgi:hypothetical protein